MSVLSVILIRTDVRIFANSTDARSALCTWMQNSSSIFLIDRVCSDCFRPDMDSFDRISLNLTPLTESNRWAKIVYRYLFCQRFHFIYIGSHCLLAFNWATIFEWICSFILIADVLSMQTFYIHCANSIMVLFRDVVRLWKATLYNWCPDWLIKTSSRASFQ